MQQTLLDGWVLRFSKGFTKRSNSIVPLYSACDESHVEDKIRYCENLYAREQLQTVFRIPSFLPDEMPQVGTLDGLLEKRGYQVQETSRVLCCNIPQPPDKPKPLAQAKFLALNEWLSVYCDLTGMAEPAQALHRIILNSIGGECGFLVLYHANQPVACGLGVLERELVGIFDIFTHEQARNQGFARCTLQSLIRKTSFLSKPFSNSASMAGKAKSFI